MAYASAPAKGAKCDVEKVFARIGVLVVALALSAPAFAGLRASIAVPNLKVSIHELQVAQADDEGGYGSSNVSIRPREAARIARQAYPGSRVLKVNLLPSGIYAVTLRGNGELTRVMVDGQTGEIL